MNFSIADFARAKNRMFRLGEVGGESVLAVTIEPGRVFSSGSRATVTSRPSVTLGWELVGGTSWMGRSTHLFRPHF